MDKPYRAIDPCGCVIIWHDLGNGHRIGETVEECAAGHPHLGDLDPSEFVEVERP